MKWTGISGCAIKRLGKKVRGFTLTELAIVLGVTGLIAGGVWALSSMAWENSRQEQVKEDIRNITKNVRAYYSGQSGVTGNFTTLTPALVTALVIPGNMVRRPAGGCTNTGTLCADGPWGAPTAATALTGSLGVCSWAAGGTACSAGTNQLFAIELRGLSVESCIKAAVRNSGSDAAPGLYDVVINGTSIINTAGVTHQFPVLVTDASGKCVAGQPIDFVFRLVAPQF